MTGVFTWSGETLDPWSIKPTDIKIVDIAHSLSMQCRYLGATDRFYSVAEHSVLVSHYVPAELAMEGLLHDATEAYVGDLVYPVKQALPGFRRLEEVARIAVSRHFGLEPQVPAAVVEIDQRIVADEMAALLPGIEPLREPPWNNPIGVEITAMSPSEARVEFLSRFFSLERSG